MALDTAKATVTLRDLTHKFDNAVRATTPFYPRICTVVPSDGFDEKYGFLGNVPGMREWLGDRQFKELRAANFTIANKHWESSLLIKKTDLADDRMAMYRMTMPQLGVEAAQHPDELVFTDLITNAAAAGCFDGQFFYDTDHSFGDSGSQSNDLTYNAVDPDAVTAAEFKAAYHAARRTMLKYKNDQNKYLNRTAITGNRSYICAVPPELEQVAWEGLYANLLGGGDSNIVRDPPEIVTIPYLSDISTRQFHVWYVGAPLKPFVFQAREPLTRQMKGLDDKETKDVKFMTESRYNAGYLAWWTASLTEFN